MDRKKQVLRYFQKKHLLTTTNTLYADHVAALFDWMVKADAIGFDASAGYIAKKENGKAGIISKQEGIGAGMEEISFLLAKKTTLSVLQKREDGKRIKKGDVIMTIQGNNQELLAFERVILNILGRMSGIATFTSELVAMLKKVSSPQLAATRKTPWMLLDKKAVAVGGGLTHRLNLSEFPLLKDTHFEIFKKRKNAGNAFTEVVKKAITQRNFFEIEIKNHKELEIVLGLLRNATIAIMLDNFTLHDAARAVKRIKKHPYYDNIIIEASGEITKENLISWAKTEIDLISMGALTHSAPTFNLSMKML